MPNRTNASDTRAEARRRARMAARGEVDESELDEGSEAEEPAPKPSFIERVIPPAPPLAGRPNPLAGFTYQGRFSGVVRATYLLRQNLVAWVAPGVLWALLAVIPLLDPASGILYLVSQLSQYVTLIAAGWFGWQRPWLFGVSAAFLGFAMVFAYAVLNPAPATTGSADQVTAAQYAAYFVEQGLIQLLLGFVAGWYGGYLRRRLADQRPPDNRGGKRR